MPEALSLLCRVSAHPESRCWALAWSPSGALLASCGGDRTVRLWGREGERNGETGTGNGETGTGNGNGTVRVWGNRERDRTVRLWGREGSGWACRAVLADGHQRTVRRVAWSPCGHFLASASFDGTTCVWRRHEHGFEVVATLEGHENEVKSVAWAPSGSLLATCSRDKSVWVWEVDEEEQEFECVSVLSAHSQDVKHVVWHPSQELLASASYDDTVRLYREDEDDWVCCATLEGHTSTVWAVAWERSGQRLVSCSDDRTLRVWQRAPGHGGGTEHSWQCVCTLSGYHGRSIYDVAWCHLTGAVATACGDDAVRVFEEVAPASPGSPVTFGLAAHVPRAHAQDANGVAWHPREPGLLASCGDDGDIAFWHYQRPEGL